MPVGFSQKPCKNMKNVQRYWSFPDYAGISNPTRNNVAQIYPPSSLSQHNPPHARFHMLWRSTFLPFCRTLFRTKSGTTNLPRCRRIPSPKDVPTRQHRVGGRTCRKLGGAGSSPKNTRIALYRAFLSLTDITLRSINTLVCFFRRKKKHSPSQHATWNRTAVVVNLIRTDTIS